MTFRQLNGLVIFLSTTLCAGEDAQLSEKLRIHIKKVPEWKAEKADVEAVFKSAANELWKFFPGRKLPVIEVEPHGGPITLFDRGPNGEIRVKLDTEGNLWAQYSYQFAHEFGHILCNYDPQKHKNKWFEESLCELASLFVLRRMAETWKTNPPYSNWKDYAKPLADYADERMKKAPLPDGKSPAEWYAGNAEVLRGNATDRPRNTIVAVVLLPLFEAGPEHWEAVTWLNTERLTPLFTFKDYLQAWQKNCPEKHKAFVVKIAERFGIQLENKL